MIALEYVYQGFALRSCQILNKTKLSILIG